MSRPTRQPPSDRTETRASPGDVPRRRTRSLRPCTSCSRSPNVEAGEPAFLLEIGTEEIPDWMISTALENLRLSFEKLEIPHESVRLDATPRRLVLRAEGLPARQPDSVERVLGPPKSAPAQAVAGFARKQGIQPERPEGGVHPQGRVLHLSEEGAGPEHHRHSGRERSPASSSACTSPRPCTGPARAVRASSVPSAGSSPCSATTSSPSNWPACAPAR